MKRLPNHYGYQSHAIHAGEPDNDANRAHTAPIYQTSTFAFGSVEQGRRIFANQEEGFVYTRWSNPTIQVIAEKIAALEGMELRRQAAPGESIEVFGQAFSSGMAAISTLFLALLRPGDTVITHGSLYGGTTELVEQLLPELHIEHRLVRMDDPDQIEKAIRKAQRPKLVYLETPANPTLQMCDITAVAEVAHANGLLVAVDNTFATPVLQQPLALGADFVIHSTTKYINGHGTTVGGMLVSTDGDFMHGPLWRHMERLGGSPSPFDAWLIDQGLKTLPLRMERHCSNAGAVAQWLEERPDVAYVYYPGLEHFPHHELAKRQMKGFGGMIAFELKSGFEGGVRLMDNLDMLTLAVSLGTVDTLIEHPASMTHAGVSPEEREEVGITDGLVRISVGLEDVEDILEDLDQALGGLAVSGAAKSTSTVPA